MLLLGGSGSAWADTVIFDSSEKEEHEGWTYSSSFSSTSNYCLYSYGTGAVRTYTSNSTFTITDGQTIKINAKKASTNSQTIRVKYSSDNGSTYDTAEEIDISGASDFTDFIINTDYLVGSYKIQFELTCGYIKTITLVNAASSPVLSITPNESASFGERESSTSKEYTVTNSGTGTLNVTIAKASGDSEFGVSKTSITGLGAGDSETFNITYTYNGESLGDKSATITVTPETGDAVNISASATTLKANDPHISVTPAEDATFGEVTANQTKTYTVTNTGTGLMSVNISNTNTTDFYISKTSISKLARNESETFTVTFNYDSESLGDKAATITVTPTYKEADAVTISASATATNVSAFEEDFSDGIPSSWYNEDDTWRTNITGHLNEAGPYYGGNKKILRTQRLSANEDEVLTFEVINASSSTYFLKAEYSTDCVSWNTIDTYTTSGKKSFTAPSTNYYWLRFTGYVTYIDNFSGFGIPASSHEITIASSTVPTSGIRYLEYTANAKIINTGGLSETLTAELYFDDEKVAEIENIVVDGNREANIDLTFTPTTAKTAKAYIRIYNTNIDKKTDKIDLTVSEPDITLDEDATSPSWTTGASKSVHIKYTARDGWNTITLPFTLSLSSAATTVMNKIFGTGWKAYEMNSYDNGVLGFTKVTTFTYGKPYIVYVQEAATHTNGVVVTASYAYGTTSASNKTVDGTTATFTSTYAKLNSMPANSYGLTTAGQIRKAGSGASIKGFRGYFTGVSAPTGEARISIVLEDEEGTTTDLGFVKMVDPKAEHIYTLSGQKVQKGKKGIYIVNGRKVVIK